METTADSPISDTDRSLAGSEKAGSLHSVNREIMGSVLTVPLATPSSARITTALGPSRVLSDATSQPIAEEVIRPKLPAPAPSRFALYLAIASGLLSSGLTAFASYEMATGDAILINELHMPSDKASTITAVTLGAAGIGTLVSGAYVLWHSMKHKSRSPEESRYKTYGYGTFKKPDPVMVVPLNIAS